MNKIILLILLLFPQLCFGSLEFDGNATNNNNINCGTADIMQENRALSVMIRFKADTLGTNNAGRFFRRPTASAESMEFQIGGVSGNLQFRFGGTTALLVTTTTTISTGTEYTVILTWDGSTTASNVHIYLNGTEVSYTTQTNGAGLYDTAGQTMYFGNREALDREFDGIFHEVAMWSKVLSANEIEILSKGKVRNLPLQLGLKTNLELYLTMDEGAEGAAADSDGMIDFSSNNYSCTASAAGMTWRAETVLSYP